MGQSAKSHFAPLRRRGGARPPARAARRPRALCRAVRPLQKNTFAPLAPPGRVVYNNTDHLAGYRGGRPMRPPHSPQKENGRQYAEKSGENPARSRHCHSQIAAPAGYNSTMDGCVPPTYPAFAVAATAGALQGTPFWRGLVLASALPSFHRGILQNFKAETPRDRAAGCPVRTLGRAAQRPAPAGLQNAKTALPEGRRPPRLCGVGTALIGQRTER